MKKFKKEIFILLIIILISLGTRVYAVAPTLEQIVNSFNNCSTVKEYTTYGSIWKASTNGNKLNVEVRANNQSTNIEYTLEGSILSSTFSGNDAFTGSAVTIVLVDSIGQLHGYSDGDLFTSLNSEKIYDYSVENEGFEIKKLSDTSIQVKIDINKKIPLIDVSNEYIEVSDIEDLKKFIAGDGSAEKSKGNVWFNKSGYDGENTLLVAEKNELTESTYKSILSIVEVMFNSNKAANYFKENYPRISVENKEFEGFKIEVNPTKTEFEERLIPESSNYKFVRITIEKNLANSAIQRYEAEQPTPTPSPEPTKPAQPTPTLSPTPTQTQDPNQINKDDSTAKGKLPQTGVSMNILLIIISVTIALVILYKKYNYYKNIK